MKIWINDPKTGKSSVTLTLFLIGFFVGTAKLALSALTIYGMSFETFSGADYAAVIGAVGAIYGFRKYTDKNKTDATDSGNEEDGV